jgi:glyoxylase-like metal-dependent hydrolase (beta-lactamase superfamily II)
MATARRKAAAVPAWGSPPAPGLRNLVAGGFSFFWEFKAVAQSSLILLTHEHADHIGGLTTHPNLAAVLAATKLTREQIAAPTAMLPARFPDHALDGYVPIDYRKYDAVAPGMVPWHFRNIEVQRERPRFATHMIEEDRAAVFGQLRALQRLHEAEPRINIVPGHDGVAVERLIDARLMRPRFGSTASDQRN